MRFSDIIVEFDDTSQVILDIVTIMAGEDTHSLPIEAIQQELFAQGIEISDDTLFDQLQQLAIVSNIKDDIVYFNTNGPAHDAGTGEEPSDAEGDNTVSHMAQKQVDKGLDK